MIIKYGLMLLYIILLSSFKIKLCIYITSGINILNRFLYRSRLSTYSNQNNINICSLNDGPNCYFTENKYIKHYLETNNENKNTKINDEWIKLYSLIPKDKYENVFNNLFKYTSTYINLYSKEIDIKQHPKSKKLKIIMTFDDETTEKNMYLTKLSNFFYHEQLIADFEGKLRLYSDEDEFSEKDSNLKESNYPSNLYGIIESQYVSISFRGNIFILNYCYVKPHDEKSKEKEMTFFGSLSDKILFGYSYKIDKNQKNEKWIKVTFPTKVGIDKLTISGPFDIDNISFTFSYKINVDENEIYYMYNHKRKKLLIDKDK